MSADKEKHSPMELCAVVTWIKNALMKNQIDAQMCKSLSFSNSLVNLRAMTSAQVVREGQKKAEWLPCFSHGTKRVRGAPLPVVNLIIIVCLYCLSPPQEATEQGSHLLTPLCPASSEKVVCFEPILVYFRFIPAVNKHG